MRCIICGAELNEGTDYCMNCGARIERNRKKLFCKHCGNTVSENDRFCNKCGSSLNDFDSIDTILHSDIVPEPPKRIISRSSQKDSTIPNDSKNSKTIKKSDGQIEILAYVKSFEPLWDGWTIGELLGRGSYGTVFQIDNGDKHAALKYYHVFMPEEISANIDDRREYVSNQIESVKLEFQTVTNLLNYRNLVRYEDIEIKNNEETAEIFIRMELLTPLIQHVIQNGISEKEIIKIGLDICAALEILHNKKIIHRDIKPNNIFYDGSNYKLGDYSEIIISASDSKKYGIAGSKSTIAPEVFGNSSYDLRCDIYSLGMTLYYIAFGTTYISNEFDNNRLMGRELPDLNSISKELSRVIKKACAYDVENRYKNVEEFKKSLEEIKGVKDSILYKGSQFQGHNSGESIERTVVLYSNTYNENGSPKTFVTDNDTNGRDDTFFREYDQYLYSGTNTSAFRKGKDPSTGKKIPENESKTVAHIGFISWLFLTCIISLVPAIFYLLCIVFDHNARINPNVFVHEFVFFSIIMLTTMIKTILFGKKKAEYKKVMIPIGIVGAIMDIIAFGIFTLIIASEANGSIHLRDELFPTAIILAIASLFISGMAEYMEDLAS